MKKILTLIMALMMLFSSFAVVHAEDMAELKVELTMADDSLITIPSEAKFDLFINGNEYITSTTVSINGESEKLNLTFSVPNHKDGNIYYMSPDANISWIEASGRRYSEGNKIPLNTKEGMSFSLSYMPLYEEPTGIRTDEVKFIVHNKGAKTRDIKVRVCLMDYKGRLVGAEWITVKAGAATGEATFKVKPYYAGAKFYFSVTDGAREVNFADKNYKGFAVIGAKTTQGLSSTGVLEIGNSFHIGVYPENSLYVSVDGDYKASAESYINKSLIDSKTNYFIWVSKAQFKVNVFEGKKGNWHLIKSFPCSIGAKDTPTITGVFEYFQRQDRWTYPTYYVGPIMRFAPRGYALHSVLLRYNGEFADGRVGEMISHGCVRMLPDDIKWLADNMPLYTRVYVTEE